MDTSVLTSFGAREPQEGSFKEDVFRLKKQSQVVWTSTRVVAMSSLCTFQVLKNIVTRRAYAIQSRGRVSHLDAWVGYETDPSSRFSTRKKPTAFGRAYITLDPQLLDVFLHADGRRVATIGEPHVHGLTICW